MSRYSSSTSTTSRICTDAERRTRESGSEIRMSLEVSWTAAPCSVKVVLKSMSLLSCKYGGSLTGNTVMIA